MGEELLLFPPELNGSIRIEARPERLTAEPGAIILRESMESASGSSTGWCRA